jgi:hypothetical protein
LTATPFFGVFPPPALGLAAIALLALAIGLRLAPAPAHAEPPGRLEPAASSASAPALPDPAKSSDAAWRTGAAGPGPVAPSVLARAADRQTKAGRAAACPATASPPAAAGARCLPSAGVIESVEIDWHVPAASP